MTDTRPLLLPQGARMVHIGPPKTGSTAIQNALHGVRDALPEHGVTYPGRRNRPRQAGWAVLGMGVPRGRPAAKIEAWHELVREVEEAGDHRVCISNEDWGKADVAAARRIVEGLGGERAHVVSVVRRLDTLLPSTWQERVKAKTTLSYEEWLRIVLGDASGSPVWRNVWVPQDAEKLVERWAQAVDRDRITLIVMDDSDRDLLPRTFEQMLGLPEGLLTLDADLSNRSLSMNEVELVRHVNRVFAENEWPEEAYWRLVQGGIVKLLKSVPRSAEEQAIPPLPGWAADRVAELSDRRADILGSLGVHVVGDPDTLRTPAANAVLAEDTEPLTVSFELAARAVHGTIEAAFAREARVAAQRRGKQPRGKQRRGARARSAVSVDDLTSKQLLRVVRQRAVRRLRGPQPR